MVDGLWNKVCVGAGRRVAIIVNLLSLIGVSDRTTYITQYTQHILHNTYTNICDPRMLGWIMGGAAMFIDMTISIRLQL